MSSCELSKSISMLKNCLAKDQHPVEPFLLQWMLTELEYFEQLRDFSILPSGWSERLNRLRLDERAARDVGEADLTLFEQLLRGWDALLDLEVEFRQKATEKINDEHQKDLAYAKAQEKAWQLKQQAKQKELRIKQADPYKRHSRRDKR